MVAPDAALLDITGPVVEKTGAGFDVAVFVSLRQAAAHESCTRSGVAVAVYCCRCCGGKASSCTICLNNVRALPGTKSVLAFKFQS